MSTPREFVEPAPATADDIFITTAELAQRWRMKKGSLINQRYTDQGIPRVRLPCKKTVYRLADIVAAEERGGRGFSWYEAEIALMKKPGMTTAFCKELIDHLRATLKQMQLPGPRLDCYRPQVYDPKKRRSVPIDPV
jgi:hypothetical protein